MQIRDRVIDRLYKGGVASIAPAKSPLCSYCLALLSCSFLQACPGGAEI